ncbi:carboxylating nicotinate-nucleotide diphosphorylase [Thermanaerosceptrum fracticalcis]|uniref:Probable nicotinate-nucleotide pyrophosphorylase [carboxylating] n=1 Tax=Thermanaerosceptrum fracticalcis TaxID=1712410 RepID=A0A7G6E375_THEFR|nr:carboxylating nicotinate-nucleotide diphosphorylase [Thermanaerosceptrum fracticalcis]QNB46529.1 carboxylating nicotinate-nucleotide diphosphorylase [Thermanaerosceptrum fracticalcis]
MNWFLIDEKIKEWLQEDMNNGDVTTDSLVDEESLCAGNFIAKEEGIIAGLEVMKRVFELLDDHISINLHVKDGERVKRGEVIASIKGKTKSILKGERLALNLLQRLSGIATETAQYVDLIRDLNVRLVDTRKTTPGLRIIEKYAVKIGGGYNHRFNLSEAVLIKDNHIAATGSIKNAIEKAKENIPHTMKIEIEVETLGQMEEAIAAGADIVLLDNMDIAMLKEAVSRNKGRVILEASGNITRTNIREIAKTGVDIISVGAITHSVKAMDISLKFTY